MTDQAYIQASERLRPRLERLALQLLGDEADVEDIVQDVLLRIWEVRAEVEAPGDGLAVVMTRHACIDALRRRRHILPLGSDGNVTLEDERGGGEKSRTLQIAASVASERDERISPMLRAIEALPAIQQTVLRLRHVEEREMSDIVAALGMSEVAVRKALSRARIAVRNAFIRKSQ